MKTYMTLTFIDDACKPSSFSTWRSAGEKMAAELGLLSEGSWQPVGGPFLTNHGALGILVCQELVNRGDAE